MKKIIFMSLILLVNTNISAKEITVATAANVQFAMKKLQNVFKQESGIIVRTVISSSGKLTAQIKSGAPFDIFLSANMKYPKYLQKKGFAATKPRIYARGSLVVWTLKPIDVKAGIESLTNPKVKDIAIPNPKNAPYGIQAINAMKSAGIYNDIKPKLIYAESISQTNQYTASKIVDIGITAKSVVLSPKMKGIGHYSDVNRTLYKPITQGIVILKHGQKYHYKEVHAFYDFIFSPKGKKIFREFGYIEKRRNDAMFKRL